MRLLKYPISHPIISTFLQILVYILNIPIGTCQFPIRNLPKSDKHSMQILELVNFQQSVPHPHSALVAQWGYSVYLEHHSSPENNNPSQQATEHQQHMGPADQRPRPLAATSGARIRNFGQAIPEPDVPRLTPRRENFRVLRHERGRRRDG